jgi:hypothetical protein
MNQSKTNHCGPYHDPYGLVDDLSGRSRRAGVQTGNLVP